MADKATGSSSASIFLDEIKSAMSGSFNYEPADSTQKWVFAEVSVNSDAALLGTGNDYLGAGTAVATGDKYYWVAIKNISSSKTDGVGINLDGGDSTSITDATSLYLAGGEMVILKAPNTTVANLHVGSVTMDGTYGYPSATNSSAVTVQVAAILDDVSE
jgi:hypothetical protein